MYFVKNFQINTIFLIIIPKLNIILIAYGLDIFEMKVSRKQLLYLYEEVVKSAYILASPYLTSEIHYVVVVNITLIFRPKIKKKTCKRNIILASSKEFTCV